ncbi:MAG: hypothetical protein Q9M23_03285, partial [Mariprofundaceae bacterium]|nr:hypothetical protein [Mariprofundaceae bacterium]
EGMLSGQSCGCALAAAITVAERLAIEGKPGYIVAIFPDGGEKYLSTPVFSGETMHYADGI